MTWQERRQSKRKRKSDANQEISESPNTRGIQLSIKEYFQTTKAAKAGPEVNPKSGANDAADKSKQRSNSNDNISKSVRRRLLFD